MQNKDINKLANILATQAADALVAPQMFFRDLVRRAGLPQRWNQETAGVWTGDTPRDARRLIDWALAKGINPLDKTYTTLGSLLNPLLEDVGFDIASYIVALIIRYQLYQSKSLLEDLVIRYQVPQHLTHVIGEAIDIGPEIVWRGPTEELELEGLFKLASDFFDVGFLSRAIQQAASVCRIEIPEQCAQGTGFLLTNTLLLTNYHVLKPTDDAEIYTNARRAVLRFGCFTSEIGIETKGQIFKLASEQPIVHYSHTENLDYVLLRVEEKILQARNIQPAIWDSENVPVPQMGINLLQHPEGESMKVAISSNGITGVYEHTGRIQYVTRTSNGSSGAPCFNEDWKVVALHHAQKSRSFGIIREGILFSAIYQEIKSYLE
ncbi:MAG: trypsin-like peptidase domain-containing protein [Nostoc sp. DedSLP03]|uniref:trypsin-like peptidase domain-containing protein n=1 Tax=Nostoc sp. DedSLP03 TaxID=3075400 RepID=UPI002AD4F803|nr:trypsin-like peptidase domain-containing protein [Nostoc sp. DedSLP03]MDZ7969125.1 trypsin-like peptidase domain-containing protein [Nostoc sp. DedSLP03]